MTIQAKTRLNYEKAIAGGKRLTYPVSITQRQFWLIHQLVDDSPAYNIQSVFQIQGDLDIAVLENSINKIIQRHEIFRTNFESIGGEPMQVVAEEMPADFTTKNLQNIPKSPSCYVG